jgi:hypothetical protein
MADNKSKIMWESKGKAPNGDSFLTVKMARGYYCYSERPGKDSIGFILYDDNIKKFALIYEAKPPLDERMDAKVMMTTAFGGSIDMQHSYKEICQVEVREEAGYDVPLDNITSVGKTLVSTQMSQLMEGFLVDVTNIKKTLKTEVETFNEEGSRDPDEFKHNKTVWMNEEELVSNSDWKSIFIMCKAKAKGII